MLLSFLMLQSRIAALSRSPGFPLKVLAGLLEVDNGFSVIVSLVGQKLLLGESIYIWLSSGPC